LTVAIRSEGVGETQQELEGVERTLEDTADSAGDSAAELEGFSERFSGAMSAAVTALAIGAAGLLSQVPVLGESFAGLAAIVEAVAFQMDSVLRPVLTPITDAFFGIADAIFSLDGILGGLVGGFATVASILAVVTAAATALFAKFGVGGTVLATIVGTFGLLFTAVKTAAGAIATFVAGSVTAAAAIGALIGTLGVAVLEVTGVLDMFRSLGQYVGSGLPSEILNGMLAVSSAILAPLAVVGAAILGFVQGFLEGGLSKGISQAVARSQEAFGIFATAWANTADNVGNVIVDILQYFVGLGSDLVSWADDIAEDAYDWGVALIQSMIDGMVSLAESIAQAVENVINGMINTINTALDQLPEEVSSRVGVSQISEVDFSGNIAGSNGETSGTAPGFREPPDSVTSSGGAQIDGRQLSESTGRYRSDPGRRRGL